jgi:hypothetical protein
MKKSKVNERPRVEETKREREREKQGHAEIGIRT